MELIKMTDFVLDKSKRIIEGNKTFPNWDYSGLDFEDCINYANFLKRTLELGMFIPCIDGEPIFHTEVLTPESNLEAFGQYQKAKEKVLFDETIKVATRE